MTKKKEEISPAGSSKGFRFNVWVRKNKNKIKQVVSIFGGIAVVVIAKNAMLVDLGLGAGTAVAIDLAIDWLDYRYSDVKLDPVGAKK